MTKHAATRLITLVLGITALVAVAHALAYAAKLRRQNRLLINASEVYREAAQRRGYRP